MKLHWKVLAFMAAGTLTGMIIRATVDGPQTSGLVVDVAESALVVTEARGPAKKAGFHTGTRITRALLERATPNERSVPLAHPDDLTRLVVEAHDGAVLWLVADGNVRALTLELDPTSLRATLVRPFAFAGDIFLLLLKMLIVPLVLTSVTSGVAGLGSVFELRRLGIKTFGYYLLSSTLAIVIGQVVVNIIRPGEGARLGLPPVDKGGMAPDASFVDVILRMIPENIFASMTDNGAMLAIIFFALLFGLAITMTPAPHGERVKAVVESLFEVMMRLAEGVLRLIPYGVFALLVKTVALTGTSIFKPLFLFVVTVVCALALHACVALPLLLRAVGKVSPRRWGAAMSPALLTAFSTSSSSMTLPVTLETVERRGGASQKVASFTLPLGATINMDGTALYECVGVIFLAQYYTSLGGFELTLGMQATVVVLALLASIGAAGIPSAGLVMMLTILAALGLPLEGAAVLLAIDRPLDMLRTTVNVWSDTVAAAIIAASEGDTLLPES
jgi:proton glutamate symport protein